MLLQTLLCSFLFTVVPRTLILLKFFICQLMHKRIALKVILKFTLKQLRHYQVFYLSNWMHHWIKTYIIIYIKMLLHVLVNKPPSESLLPCFAKVTTINPLSPELNPICYFLALLAHDLLHVSRIRVKSLTLRLLMSYIYGAPILDVSRSHTTTQRSW
jgi:transposase